MGPLQIQPSQLHLRKALTLKQNLRPEYYRLMGREVQVAENL